MCKCCFTTLHCRQHRVQASRPHRGNQSQLPHMARAHADTSSLYQPLSTPYKRPHRAACQQVGYRTVPSFSCLKRIAGLHFGEFEITRRTSRADISCECFVVVVALKCRVAHHLYCVVHNAKPNAIALARITEA